MKLGVYMKLSRLTDEKFAALLGKDRTTAMRYRRGDVVPPIRVAAQIEAITEGAVTFRDFLQTERSES